MCVPVAHQFMPLIIYNIFINNRFRKGGLYGKRIL